MSLPRAALLGSLTGLLLMGGLVQAAPIVSTEQVARTINVASRVTMTGRFVDGLNYLMRNQAATDAPGVPSKEVVGYIADGEFYLCAFASDDWDKIAGRGKNDWLNQDLTIDATRYARSGGHLLVIDEIRDATGEVWWLDKGRTSEKKIDIDLK